MLKNTWIRLLKRCKWDATEFIPMGGDGFGYVTKITDGEHTVEGMVKSSKESQSRACLSKQHKTNKEKN